MALAVTFASANVHEPIGINIELANEPVIPLLQDAGPILLDGISGYFARPHRRAKKRRSPATKMVRAISAQLVGISPSEMSLRATQRANVLPPRLHGVIACRHLGALRQFFQSCAS